MTSHRLDTCPRSGSCLIRRLRVVDHRLGRLEHGQLGRLHELGGVLGGGRKGAAVVPHPT